MQAYTYLPGLARQECLALQAGFDEKVAGVFGADPFIVGAVEALRTKRSVGVDCGVALNWVDTAKAGKAFKTMGGLRQHAHA